MRLYKEKNKELVKKLNLIKDESITTFLPVNFPFTDNK